MPIIFIALLLIMGYVSVYLAHGTGLRIRMYGVSGRLGNPLEDTQRKEYLKGRYMPEF